MNFHRRFLAFLTPSSSKKNTVEVRGGRTNGELESQVGDRFFGLLGGDVARLDKPPATC
jgi:hypothetical protein